jgi:hypothetical protein
VQQFGPVDPVVGHLEGVHGVEGIGVVVDAQAGVFHRSPHRIQ